MGSEGNKKFWCPYSAIGFLENKKKKIGLYDFQNEKFHFLMIS